MKQIGIVVAGTGFGVRSLLPALHGLEGVRVLALVGGTNKNKTQAAARAWRIPIATDDFALACKTAGVQLAWIASPHIFHYEMVKEALSNQLHVVCEKPLALNREQVCELVHLSSGCNQLHLVNHQLRFHTPVRKVRDLLRAGAIGEVYCIVVYYKTDRYVNPQRERRLWWFDAATGGGMILAMGPHLLDLIQFWLGKKILSVRGQSCRIFDFIDTIEDPNADVRVESCWNALIRLEGGVCANISCTAAGFEQSQLVCHLYGDRGELCFSAPGQLCLSLCEGDAIQHRMLLNDPSPNYDLTGATFQSALDEFTRILMTAVRTNDFNIVEDATDFEDYARKHDVLEALRRSCHEGGEQVVAHISGGKVNGVAAPLQEAHSPSDLALFSKDDFIDK